MTDRSPKKTGWRGFRATFRWCRITGLLVVLAAAGTLWWFNRVGVPSFVTQLVKQELRRKNVALDFTSLRLRGFRRLVADDVSLAPVGGRTGPALRIHEAELLLNLQRLRHGEVDLSGFRLDGAEMRIPIALTNERPWVLSVTNVYTEVQFLPGDILVLGGFSADVLSTRVRASGLMRRFSHLRVGLSGDEPGWLAATRPWLLRVLRSVENLDFAQPPAVTMTFSADAGRPASSRAQLRVACGPVSGWEGEISRLEFTAGLEPLGTNEVEARIFGDIENYRGELGAFERVLLSDSGRFSGDFGQLITNALAFSITNLSGTPGALSSLSGVLHSAQAAPGARVDSAARAEAAGFEAFGLRAAAGILDLSLVHPALGSGEAGLTGTGRVEANGLARDGTALESLGLALEWEQPRFTLAGAGGWDAAAFLKDLRVGWHGVLSNLQARSLRLERIALEGEWAYPGLAATNFSASLCGGEFSGAASLDVTSGYVTGELAAKFDYREFALGIGWAGERERAWLEEITWPEPPEVRGSFALQWPEWGEPSSGWEEWPGRVLASLEAGGQFEGAFSYRGVAVNHASTGFHLARQGWSLPDLALTCGGGTVRLAAAGSFTNTDFSIRLESGLDPRVFRPLVTGRRQGRLMDMLRFPTPPQLAGFLTGRWEDLAGLVFEGTIEASNFFLRDQLFTSLRSEVLVTNQEIHCRDLELTRGPEVLELPYARIEPANEVMFVTNAVSTLDPYIAMSLVGNDAYEAIDPYRFGQPPRLRVSGYVPLRHYSKSNLQFHVDGEDFRFWKFHLPAVQGDVHWRGDQLTLSNVVADFYGGTAHWSGSFKIDHRVHSARYSFQGTTDGSDLRALLADLWAGTNRIEGTLSGSLTVTSADSGDARSWHGHATAEVEEGMLWNVPIFGIFSPVLDALRPGLGSNRVKSGSGNFVISNSVVHTEDLQVRAPAFRLNYAGTVDLDGRLDARVEAEMFRDAWVVGRLFSLALWPVSKAFEANVSGTLAEPKTSLRYFFPKFILAPFRALNALTGRGSRSEESRPAEPKSAEPAPSP